MLLHCTAQSVRSAGVFLCAGQRSGTKKKKVVVGGGTQHFFSECAHLTHSVFQLSIKARQTIDLYLNWKEMVERIFPIQLNL